MIEALQRGGSGNFKVGAAELVFRGFSFTASDQWFYIQSQILTEDRARAGVTLIIGSQFLSLKKATSFK